MHSTGSFLSRLLLSPPNIFPLFYLSWLFLLLLHIALLIFSISLPLFLPNINYAGVFRPCLYIINKRFTVQIILNYLDIKLNNC